MENDYYASRREDLYIPLEKSKPVKGAWKCWVAGLFLAVFVGLVIVMSLAG